MQLHFIKSGNGYPLIILHGLFGMLDNWKTIAKELEKYFTVYLVDQRNHGKSPHTEEHSYSLLSDDLLSFFLQNDITAAHILGHSMGGKAAMEFTLQHPEKVNKLIVVDMGIKRYTGGHDIIFEALFSIDLTKIHYRSDAEKILLDKVTDFGIRQFILKNLVRDEAGNYSWKFNLMSLYRNYESHILAAIPSIHVSHTDALFIRGKNSNYILDEDWGDIHSIFSHATLITIKNAGHWVHADQPLVIINSIKNFLLD